MSLVHYSNTISIPSSGSDSHCLLRIGSLLGGGDSDLGRMLLAAFPINSFAAYFLNLDINALARHFYEALLRNIKIQN